MADLKAIAYWGGINDFVSASMTFTPGVGPNVCTLTIPPQDPGSIFGVGDLVWQFNGSTWTFRRCRLQSIQQRLSEKGIVWDLSILDRRWIWSECGKISGYYNARQGEKMVPGTEKDPQELARLCFKALGERRYDVSGLPIGARPEIDWDFIRPAEALGRLCDGLGCQVVLGLDDVPRIVRKYVGAQLPIPNVMSGDVVMSPPDPPDKISVVCARTRYQADLQLEPVGLETDYSIKPIDDLSYKPAQGWEYADIQEFSGIANEHHQKLALQSVYRWFRVVTPFTLPGLSESIDDVRRVLPLGNEQVEKWEYRGRRVPLPAWVYGRFYDGNADTTNKLAQVAPQNPNLPLSGDRIWTHGFSIDAETGIVQLSEPAYLNVPDGNNATVNGRPVDILMGQLTPELMLRTTVSLRDSETWGWQRKTYDRRFSGQSSAPGQTRYYRHDDLVHEIYTRYTMGRGIVEDNKSTLQPAANYYLDAHAIEYNPEESATIQYAGLIPIQPDGAIWQVAWTIQGGIGTTTATRNHEELSLSLSYTEKRFLQKLAEDQVERNKPQRQREDDAFRRKAPT